jgi:hypothetical protein
MLPNVLLYFHRLPKFRGGSTRHERDNNLIADDAELGLFVIVWN